MEMFFRRSCNPILFTITSSINICPSGSAMRKSAAMMELLPAPFEYTYTEVSQYYHPRPYFSWRYFWKNFIGLVDIISIANLFSQQSRFFLWAEFWTLIASRREASLRRILVWHSWTPLDPTRAILGEVLKMEKTPALLPVLDGHIQRLFRYLSYSFQFQRIAALLKILRLKGKH